MTEAPTSFDCVVDASVGIKLFLVEPLSDAAHALLAHLTDDPPARLYVPELFFVECANILWKYVRRFGYPAADALQDIGDLVRLPLQRVSMAALAVRQHRLRFGLRGVGAAVGPAPRHGGRGPGAVLCGYRTGCAIPGRLTTDMTDTARWRRSSLKRPRGGLLQGQGVRRCWPTCATTATPGWR
jgi:predicted nucleic acid-binding protein